jgi:glycosyltransferase involved in cell wall biosynthesis
MRFVLVGNCFGRGGIQTHLRWMAEILRGDRHDVLLLATQPRRDGEADAADLDSAGIAIRDFPVERAGRWAKRERLRQMAACVRDFQPDVFFAVGVSWLPMLLRPLAARRSRAIFFEVLSGNWNRWTLDPRVFTRLSFDEVIGQSPRVCAAFRRAFSWGKAVAPLPAIPEPLEQIARIPNAVAHRVPHGRMRAALFSRLDPTKRAFWLVQQWDQLNDVIAELHIHGSGPDESAIRSWIKANEYGGRVVCHGRYPDGQEYVDLLRSYDVTLLPTHGDEGAPLVLLESMACGVPFVATGVGGIPDYGRNNPDCAIAAVIPDGFIAQVRTLADRLDRSKIDQGRLQAYYNRHFAHQVLRRDWLRFLTTPGSKPFCWPGI